MLKKKNGQISWACSRLSRLTLKFKKVTLCSSVRAALPDTTAASNTGSLHTAAAVLLLAQLALPAPPPPLCCHGNTHTEQSGRPMPRARYRGCCSDCRCISRHPPAWPGRWWGCRRWGCALGASDHYKETQTFLSHTEAGQARHLFLFFYFFLPFFLFFFFGGLSCMRVP